MFAKYVGKESVNSPAILWYFITLKRTSKYQTVIRTYVFRIFKIILILSCILYFSIFIWICYTFFQLIIFCKMTMSTTLQMFLVNVLSKKDQLI